MLNYDSVVLVSIDTLRADCVPQVREKLWVNKYPNLPPCDLPYLEEVTSRGTLFCRTISAAPYTAASHGALFTGQFPVRNGVWEFYGGRLSPHTLFATAKQHGWRTCFKTDFPLILSEHLGFSQSVDKYIVEDDEMFLTSIGNEKFLGVVHFGGCHIPYGFHNLSIGGEKYKSTVDDLERLIDSDYPKPVDQLVETYRSADDLELLLRYKRVVEFLYSHKMYSQLFQMYLDGAQWFFKTRFQQFFDRLLERLRGKRYLIVLFGDHGEEYDDESYGHHNSLAEGVLQVPLLFCGTDIGVKSIKERARTIDVLPTICKLVGFLDEHSHNRDGNDLSGAILHSELIQEQDAVSQSYTSDTHDFVKFQADLLGRKQHKGFLRHVKYGESIYCGNHRLVCRYFRYHGANGIWGLQERPIEREMYARSERGAYLPVTDPRMEVQLIERLQRYDSLRVSAFQPEAPTKLKAELRAMGYRV